MSCIGSASAPARCHALQDVPYSLIRDGIAEIGQRAYNSVVTPPGILPRHFDDQLLQLRLDCRPAGIAAVFGAIELLGDEFPVPAQDRVRLSGASHLGQSLA